MEERQFLHRLCTTALQVDASIQFAGIIDSKGKLLVGKSRNIRHNPHFSKGKITRSSFKNSNHYGNSSNPLCSLLTRRQTKESPRR